MCGLSPLLPGPGIGKQHRRGAGNPPLRQRGDLPQHQLRPWKDTEDQVQRSDLETSDADGKSLVLVYDTVSTGK